MHGFRSAVFVAFALFLAGVAPALAQGTAQPPDEVPLISAAPPSATIKEASEYYLYDRDQQVGPLSRLQVLDRIASGESDTGTFVWTANLDKWVPIGMVLQFAAALPPADEPGSVMKMAQAGIAGEDPGYYLYDDGVQSGPLSGNDILLGIDAGTISPEAMIWQQGWSDWQGLATVEAFADAVANAPAPSPQYYVVANGERVGPLSEDEVLARIAADRSGADDLAWKKGMGDWGPLGQFAEFEQALIEASIPPLPDDGRRPLPGIDEPPPLPPVDTATLETQLATAIRAAVGEYFGSAPQAEQDKAIACMAALAAPLDAAAKQQLVFTNMGGTGDVPLVEAYRAGLGDEIWECIPQSDDDEGTAVPPASRRT